VRDAAGWKAATLKQHEWLPQLTVGDHCFTAASFDDTGTLNQSPEPEPVSA